MYLNKKDLLGHFEIVCKDRISTLIEDSCRGMNCNCDIEKESCNECVFWADGVRNYQLYLGDIAETRKADSKTVKTGNIKYKIDNLIDIVQTDLNNDFGGTWGCFNVDEWESNNDGEDIAYDVGYINALRYVKKEIK